LAIRHPANFGRLCPRIGAWETLGLRGAFSIRERRQSDTPSRA
jgi:hypothetical protein